MPDRVSDIRIALILEEQHHDLRVAIEGRQVQRGRPMLIPLPLEWRSLGNESLGFCRLSTSTSLNKCLVDVQSALQVRVSAKFRAASAASHFRFETRSRRTARGGGNAYLSEPITFRMMLS